MNVSYSCPHCDAAQRADVDETAPELVCRECGHRLESESQLAAGGKLNCCLVCRGGELFVRKDFSQRLGVAIVVLGLAASCIPWYLHYWYATYAILFGTALLDVVLYFVMGNVLECYRCHAQYRGVAGLDEHGAFRLEVYERYRQQAARLKAVEK